MLLMIGPVRLSLAPFNPVGYEHSHETRYAVKPVVGGSEPLEFIGEGANTWTIQARLFPERFGGESGLSILELARRSGRPQYLMRGDGRLMGWVAILSVTERSSFLDASGVGRVIDVDITVRRSPRPSSGLYFAIFGGLFG